MLFFYALLTQNFVVKIYMLFPADFSGLKRKIRRLFYFWNVCRCTQAWKDDKPSATLCRKDGRYACWEPFNDTLNYFCECGCTSEGLTVDLYD